MSRSLILHTPLRWPDNWPRTHSRKPANFDGDRTITQAVRELHAALSAKSGPNPFARDIQITAADGTSKPRGVDPGAAVYFKRSPTVVGIDPGSFGAWVQPAPGIVLACDKWDDAAHNVWALVLHVKALRGLERWGVGSVEQAFAGYAALPASPHAAPYVAPPRAEPHTVSEPRTIRPGTWRQVLGFRPKSKPRPSEIDDAFKTLARFHHPDVGGSNETMQLLNVARDEAMNAVSR